MAQPYVGEIRMFGGNYAPDGWMFCNGQILPISEYDTLFMLIGTTYGGDGQETFALPDMQGRIPINVGGGHNIGEPSGTETVTLNTNELPMHTHPLLASTSVANSPNPGDNLLGKSSQASMFFGDPTNVNMSPAAVSPTGGNQPHDNMMPYLCVSFIISLYGIFPSPN
jgi:microcystin-dependent protein